MNSLQLTACSLQPKAGNPETANLFALSSKLLAVGYRLLAVSCWLWAINCFPAHAITVEKPLSNASQEAVAQQVFHQLKCVVCEGQPLSESDAPLALDMRALIREHVREGKSQQEVIDFFVARYGEAILLSPPLTAHSGVLWIAPFLLIVLGGAALWRTVRKAKS